MRTTFHFRLVPISNFQLLFDNTVKVLKICYLSIIDLNDLCRRNPKGRWTPLVGQPEHVNKLESCFYYRPQAAWITGAVKPYIPHPGLEYQTFDGGVPGCRIGGLQHYDIGETWFEADIRDDAVLSALKSVVSEVVTSARRMELGSSD